MKENRRREWITKKMDKGLSKWYAPYFTGESTYSDSFLINIAYQIGKMEGRKDK